MNLIQQQNVIRFIKSQTTKIVTSCGKDARRNRSHKNLKMEACRPIGRLKIRWEDDIRKDLQTMRIKNWKKSALDRDCWKTIVERTKAHDEL
jgi:hypothetical protein